MPDIVPVVFDNPARGWHPFVPPGSRKPTGGGPIWRDANNFRFNDGYATKRESLSLYDTPPQELENTSLTAGRPYYIQFDRYDTADVLVCVSDKRIHIKQFTTWYDVTPIFTTGTVNVSGAVVTAASGAPAWQDRGIVGGQTIQLSGTWYTILSVDSNTQITLTSSAGTHTGISYTIKRLLQSTLPIFAVDFNNDLYVAGNVGGGGQNGPTVIKVPDCFNLLTGAVTPGEYLTSAVELVVGLDVLPIDIRNTISGLSLLDDGRVVISLYGIDGQSQIRYSSHLNTAVWTTSPGGATQTTAVPGVVRASKRYGNSVVCHYDRGIAMGQPTGQDDPPLAWRPTKAHLGTTRPTTLVELGSGRQGFIGPDGNAYIFNGSTSELVSTVPRDVAGPSVGSADPFVTSFSSWDAYRQMWSFWFLSGGVSLDETTRLTVNMADGSWGKAQFPLPLYAASGGKNPTFDVREIVGVYSLEPPSGPGNTGMLYGLQEDSAADSVPAWGASDGGWFLTSDDFTSEELGLEHGRRIHLEKMEVWIEGLEAHAAETIRASVSYDGGAFLNHDRSVQTVASSELGFWWDDWQDRSGTKIQIQLSLDAAAAGDSAAMVSKIVAWVSTTTDRITNRT